MATTTLTKTNPKNPQRNKQKGGYNMSDKYPITIAVCSGKRATHIHYATPLEIYVNNRKIYDSDDDPTLEVP
jgi:hypothetical protein